LSDNRTFSSTPLTHRPRAAQGRKLGVFDPRDDSTRRKANQLNHNDTKSTKEEIKSNDQATRSKVFEATAFVVLFVSSWFIHQSRLKTPPTKPQKLKLN
jgi:hypothetical protein